MFPLVIKYWIVSTLYQNEYLDLRRGKDPSDHAHTIRRRRTRGSRTESSLSLLRWPLPSLPRLLAILLVGRYTSTAMCCSPSNIMARSLTIEDWRIWKELTLFPSLETVLVISWCKYEDVANTELLTFAIEYLQYLAQSRIPTCRMLKEMCLAPRPSRPPAPWASTRRSRRCSSR